MHDKYPEHQAYEDYIFEREARRYEAQDYYNLLCNQYRGKADALYEDTIINAIGEYGFGLLKEFALIECCGVIRYRRLYVL